MRSIRFLAIACLAVGFLTAYSLTAELLAQPATGKGPAKADANQKTKVFRLARTDPAEVAQVMENLLEFVPVPPPPPMPPPPQGVGFAGGGMLGGGGPPAFSVAVEPRTKSLIVRGTDKHIQLAVDLVAVVDQEKDKEPPEVKSLRGVVLKHAKPEEISEVVENLNLEAKFIPLTAAKMVIFTGSDAVMKEIGDLIKELDVAVDPEPKKVEKKRLLADPPPDAKKQNQ